MTSSASVINIESCYNINDNLMLLLKYSEDHLSFMQSSLQQPPRYKTTYDETTQSYEKLNVGHDFCSRNLASSNANAVAQED